MANRYSPASILPSDNLSLRSMSTGNDSRLTSPSVFPRHHVTHEAASLSQSSSSKDVKHGGVSPPDPPQAKFRNSLADTVPGGWAVVAPPKWPSQQLAASSSSDDHAAAALDSPYDIRVHRAASAVYKDPTARYQLMRKSQGVMRPLSSTTSQSSHLSGNGMRRGSGDSKRQRALLIGVNYTRTRGARGLTGCVNDTRLMYQMLREMFGFEDENMWVMTDEPVDVGAGVRHFQPTRCNIVNGMRWLVQGASPGDSLFFFFGGHGGQVRDTNGDELDGWDETILPCDYPSSGEIVDDDIHKIMVRGLSGGAQLTAVVDACNSGTILDLPYVHGPLGGELGNAMGIPEAKIRASAAKANVQQSKNPLISFLKPLIHKRNKRRKADAEIVELADSLQRKVALQIKDCGRVVSFSGCADNQRSVDVFARAATTAYGAMTHAFVTAIHSAELGTPECTFLSMLESMKEALRRGGHIQVPQLCCSHENILQAKFEL